MSVELDRKSNESKDRGVIVKCLFLTALLMMSCSLTARAEQTGRELAARRSMIIAQAVTQAEHDLEAALAHGGEDDYFREGMVPVAKYLRDWREGKESDPKGFDAYSPCLYAGIHFNWYAQAQWERHSSRRDRDIERYGRSYKAELAQCKRLLKA